MDVHLIHHTAALRPEGQNQISDGDITNPDQVVVQFSDLSDVCRRCRCIPIHVRGYVRNPEREVLYLEWN